MKILQDKNMNSILLMPVAIKALEDAFRGKAAGTLVSPPRHHVSFPGYGDLVFTIGGLLDTQPIAGFRVYETFDGASHTQIVAVWSTDKASLKGIFVGEALGQIRTGAIGGVAIHHLSPRNAHTVGVLGSGAQAKTQLIAAATVRDISSVRVFSRDKVKCKMFAEEMQRALNLAVEPASSAAEAIADMDIVLCATNSNTPVIQASELKPGVHINTVGPKTILGHEVGLDIADSAGLIVTDSLEQTRAYASPFFLAGSSHEHRLQELADIVAGNAVRRARYDETTLFCSVGLAGTEVVVASAIFDGLENTHHPSP